jgi:hypothetical protein
LTSFEGRVVKQEELFVNPVQGETTVVERKEQRSGTQGSMEFSINKQIVASS